MTSTVKTQALSLEHYVAELLGKEAALFVPSGVMGNQIALLLHTQRGDEVLVAAGAHILAHESGAAAALSGVQCVAVGSGGLITAEEVTRAVRGDGITQPRSALLCIENTHNAAGGRVFPLALQHAVVAAARAAQLKLHLDGARLWNASAATGDSLATLAAPYDTVMVCFSKGLGAPVGSALLGTRTAIERARRLRKQLGGGMRQAGILAAAAHYALCHQRARLVEDHALARSLALHLEQLPEVLSQASEVETNIVNVRLAQPVAFSVKDAAERAGVLLYATAPNQLRLVTHRDVLSSDAEEIGVRLAAAITAACRNGSRV
jgi:threonine aldolase